MMKHSIGKLGPLFNEVMRSLGAPTVGPGTVGGA